MLFPKVTVGKISYVQKRKKKKIWFDTFNFKNFKAFVYQKDESPNLETNHPNRGKRLH